MILRVVCQLCGAQILSAPALEGQPYETRHGCSASRERALHDGYSLEIAVTAERDTPQSYDTTPAEAREAVGGAAGSGFPCTAPLDIAAVCRDMNALEHEELHVLGFDVKRRLRLRVKIAQGTLTSTVVHPREVLKPLVRTPCYEFAVVHNHPSGVPDPSPEDLWLTNRLAAAGALLGIRLADHVIVSTGGYYSFLNAGRMPNVDEITSSLDALKQALNEP